MTEAPDDSPESIDNPVAAEAALIRKEQQRAADIRLVMEAQNRGRAPSPASAMPKSSTSTKPQWSIRPGRTPTERQRTIWPRTSPQSVSPPSKNSTHRSPTPKEQPHERREVIPGATELLNTVAMVPVEPVHIDSVAVHPRNIRSNGRGTQSSSSPSRQCDSTGAAVPCGTARSSLGTERRRADLSSLARMESPGINIQPEDIGEAAVSLPRSRTRTRSQSLSDPSPRSKPGDCQTSGADPATHAELGL